MTFMFVGGVSGESSTFTSIECKEKTSGDIYDCWPEELGTPNADKCERQGDGLKVDASTFDCDVTGDHTVWGKPGPLHGTFNFHSFELGSTQNFAMAASDEEGGQLTIKTHGGPIYIQGLMYSLNKNPITLDAGDNDLTINARKYGEYTFFGAWSGGLTLIGNDVDIHHISGTGFSVNYGPFIVQADGLFSWDLGYNNNAVIGIVGGNEDFNVTAGSIEIISAPMIDTYGEVYLYATGPLTLNDVALYSHNRDGPADRNAITIEAGGAIDLEETQLWTPTCLGEACNVKIDAGTDLEWGPKGVTVISKGSLDIEAGGSIDITAPTFAVDWIYAAGQIILNAGTTLDLTDVFMMALNYGVDSDVVFDLDAGGDVTVDDSSFWGAGCLATDGAGNCGMTIDTAAGIIDFKVPQSYVTYLNGDVIWNAKEITIKGPDMAGDTENIGYCIYNVNGNMEFYGGDSFTLAGPIGTSEGTPERGCLRGYSALTDAPTPTLPEDAEENVNLVPDPSGAGVIVSPKIVIDTVDDPNEIGTVSMQGYIFGPATSIRTYGLSIEDRLPYGGLNVQQWSGCWDPSRQPCIWDTTANLGVEIEVRLCSITAREGWENIYSAPSGDRLDPLTAHFGSPEAAWCPLQQCNPSEPCCDEDGFFIAAGTACEGQTPGTMYRCSDYTDPLSPQCGSDVERADDAVLTCTGDTGSCTGAPIGTFSVDDDCTLAERCAVATDYSSGECAFDISCQGLVEDCQDPLTGFYTVDKVCRKKTEYECTDGVLGAGDEECDASRKSTKEIVTETRCYSTAQATFECPLDVQSQETVTETITSCPVGQQCSITQVNMGGAMSGVQMVAVLTNMAGQTLAAVLAPFAPLIEAMTSVDLSEVISMLGAGLPAELKQQLNDMQASGSTIQIAECVDCGLIGPGLQGCTITALKGGSVCGEQGLNGFSCTVSADLVGPGTPGSVNISCDQGENYVNVGAGGTVTCSYDSISLGSLDPDEMKLAGRTYIITAVPLEGGAHSDPMAICQTSVDHFGGGFGGMAQVKTILYINGIVTALDGTAIGVTLKDVEISEPESDSTVEEPEPGDRIDYIPDIDVFFHNGAINYPVKTNKPLTIGEEYVISVTVENEAGEEDTFNIAYIR